MIDNLTSNSCSDIRTIVDATLFWRHSTPNASVQIWCCEQLHL